MGFTDRGGSQEKWKIMRVCQSQEGECRYD